MVRWNASAGTRIRTRFFGRHRSQSGQTSYSNGTLKKMARILTPNQALASTRVCWSGS